MEKLFKIKERGSSLSREIIGGITTFLAMSYILAVNPSILADSGMSWGAVFTATAVSAAVSTLVMAFIANMPVALAPGLGLNAFFTYSVVLGMGCSWQLALTAVFVEGILFIVLSLFGIREKIIDSIPANIKKAVAVGIGLFITIIGLVNAGICTPDTGTIIGFVNFNLAHASALVALIGIIITVSLYLFRVPGAILIGIVVTTLIGIPFGVTTIPEGWKPFTLPEAPHFFAFDFKGIVIDPKTDSFSMACIGKFFVIFFTFFFTDLFDTIGTLLGVTSQAKLIDENGRIKNVRGALFADAVGTTVGACLGTSTVTSFVESSSGVAAGARTGLASVVTAFFFLLSLFFSNFFLLIPAAATTPALVLVGYLMARSVGTITFKDSSEGIPVFVTIMTMPFSYSIAKGIMFGIISYVLSKCCTKKVKEVSVATWVLAVVFVLDLVFEAVK